MEEAVNGWLELKRKHRQKEKLVITGVDEKQQAKPICILLSSLVKRLANSDEIV